MQPTVAYHTDYIYEEVTVSTQWLLYLYKLISGKSTNSKINITILLLRFWGELCRIGEFNRTYTSTTVLIKKLLLKFMMWWKEINNNFYFSTREIVYKGTRFILRLLHRNMSIATRINREYEGNMRHAIWHDTTRHDTTRHDTIRYDMIYDDMIWYDICMLVLMYVYIRNSEAGSDLASWTLLRLSCLLIYCSHSVCYCS